MNQFGVPSGWMLAFKVRFPVLDSRAQDAVVARQCPAAGPQITARAVVAVCAVLKPGSTERL